MRAILPNRRSLQPVGPDSLRQQRDGVGRLIDPLVKLAATSDYLVAGSIGDFTAGEATHRIPRFLFLGPKGGGDTLRLGLFAALRGDEPEGAEALVAFVRELEQNPLLARGYHLYLYPVSNPTGYSAGTSCNFAGQDLTTHFWRLSNQPEVYYLEREMGVHHFDGVVSLHAVDAAGPLIARARGAITTTALAEPALAESKKHLTGNAAPTGRSPLDLLDSIPGGFLTETDELSPTPFEINLGLPRRAHSSSRIRATVEALKTLLDAYRSLQAIRQNI